MTTKTRAKRRTRSAVSSARLSMICSYMQLQAAGAGVEEVMGRLKFRSRGTLHAFRHVIRKHHGFNLPRLSGERGCESEIAECCASDGRLMSFVLIAG